MWIHTDECDSLLFSCLYAVATNTEFDVDQALFEDARYPSKGRMWHRRPLPCGDCSSTISRDMFMGLFCYALHFARLDILDSLWTYGWKHFWKMGIESKPPTPYRLGPFTFMLHNNRVWFTPGMIALLAQLRARLRGQKTLWSLVPQFYTSEPGYVSHLSMLHVYLNLRMRGHLTARETKVLQAMLAHSASNPLVHALLGDRAKALELLDKWPKGRLPTNADWEEPWATQREDKDSGHRPAPPAAPLKTHSGGDALFVKHVLALTLPTI